MGEASRSLGEKRIGDVMTAIPALAEARVRISSQPALEIKALKYVQGIWPEAEPWQLHSPHRDFILAEGAENCHLTCSGVKSCPHKGLRPGAYCEPYGDGGRIYVVRWGNCGARSSADLQASAERALKSARLPERLVGCTFETYRTAGLSQDILKAKGMALAAVSDGNSLILSGGSGVGKTHLAAAMVNARVNSGKSALFVPVPDLLDDLRSAVSTGKGSGAMDAVKKAEFLALDDLGAERLTEWVGERLYMIVNHRYLNRLQTVITTNAENIVDLVSRLGDQGQRIVSRLGEMGAWCGICAEDYRFGREGKNKTGRQIRGNVRQKVLADIPF